jgi:hypothetical protein
MAKAVLVAIVSWVAAVTSRLVVAVPVWLVVLMAVAVQVLSVAQTQVALVLPA